MTGTVIVESNNFYVVHVYYLWVYERKEGIKTFQKLNSVSTNVLMNT